ncbi:MAG: hypothetical protein A3G93_02980 [Nitrospinae bacterium RIFCSPLOWO2_12_FULL_45_22]|nr:MAG: hypothetical protein A3G93_02980 [Nitrospinae bacterium RIFCSPLOWO2_12_FULL_45_22]
MIPSFRTILDTAKDLESLFGNVKNKLLNNPTEASAKLAEVLGELSLILEFVEKETVRYLEIIFLPDKSNFIPCRSALLSLESGYVTIKGYEARGHCHKIMNIYERYLDRWFSKVLDAQEAQQIKSMFERMNSADGDMIDGIKEITRWLKNESEAILQMVDADQLDMANQQIKSARLAVQQTRRDIVEALAQLKLLQASFIVSSQTL